MSSQAQRRRTGSLLKNKPNALDGSDITDIYFLCMQSPPWLFPISGGSPSGGDSGAGALKAAALSSARRKEPGGWGRNRGPRVEGVIYIY